MDVFIDGTRIKLTNSQEQLIRKHRRKLERGFRSMESVLKHFGFKKLKDSATSFEHLAYGWYAEIYTHNENWHSVWMVGDKLKNSHLFPGGWNYDDTHELHHELTRAMAVIFNSKTLTE